MKIKMRKNKKTTREKPVKIPLPFRDALASLLAVDPKDVRRAEEREKKKAKKVQKPSK